MKEYNITINTKLVIDFEASDIPDIRDVFMGIRDLFEEKNWIEKKR